MIREYFNVIEEQLKKQLEEEHFEIERAAEYCAESILNERLIHVFGCGHSQMFAMEVFYRAGGLVPVNALLIQHLALFPKAKLSTVQERIEGFSPEYLKLENTDEKDSMIIVSISGRNAGAIDMAIAAKEIGMKVICLTSKDFSSSVTSRHSSKKVLMDLCDVVIDIKCIEGDAILEKEGVPDKFCGTSTILGMTVMESIIGQTISNCVDQGLVPPIYVSSNLDRGDEINLKHIEEYKDLIGCL